MKNRTFRINKVSHQNTLNPSNFRENREFIAVIEGHKVELFCTQVTLLLPIQIPQLQKLDRVGLAFPINKQIISLHIILDIIIYFLFD